MTSNGSIQDNYYTSGKFLSHSSGAADAMYKVKELQRAFEHVPHLAPKAVNRIADVGCGMGVTTRILAQAFPEVYVDGYDIHPNVETLESSDRVAFFRKDFCSQVVDDPYDLAVLFDVIEHVPDPIQFMRDVAARSRIVALHIPLDDSWLTGFRGNARANLEHPGHLIVLNPATALTLVALAGMRARTFTYSPVFRAPTGRDSKRQRLLNPIRGLLYRLSPWLAQHLLSGVSLMVIAETQLSGNLEPILTERG